MEGEEKSAASTPHSDLPECRKIASMLVVTGVKQESLEDTQLSSKQSQAEKTVLDELKEGSDTLRKRTPKFRIGDESEEKKGSAPVTDETQIPSAEQELLEPLLDKDIFKVKCRSLAEEELKKSDFEPRKCKKTSLRAVLVHSSSRVSSRMDDRTIRGEKDFLWAIERQKNKRLERLCICPVTRWLLFKERLSLINNSLVRIGRCFWIFCCPPLCNILPQIAFWPPPNEYFFYMDSGPPRVRKEIEGHEEAIEIAKRKKNFFKVFRADKKTSERLGWRIGHVHPCADDFDDVEAFVVKTKRNNYIACVRIPSSSISRYSILYSHPNASDLSDHLMGVPNLQDLARFYKCDVYSYDYSGYGISTGHPSESNQKADIRAIYDHLLNERTLNPKEIVLLGYSIGCFASVHLACSINEPPAGVILQAPPTSLLRVLLWKRACFEKPFKEHSCCADRFSIYEQICHVRVPVLVIHGEDDRTVPIIHGKAICERAVNRAAPLWLRATHDNIENCRDTWLRIRTFLKYELKAKIDEDVSSDGMKS